MYAERMFVSFYLIKEIAEAINQIVVDVDTERQ